MKVYLNGAITGLPFDEVKIGFSAAERSLTEQGYEVISPLKTGIPYNYLLESHILADIILLIFGCDAIYLLKDWKYSKVSTLEKNIAELIGKQIIYEKEPVFVEIKQAICEVTGISFYEITEKRHNRNIVYARMIFTHYCKEQGATITDISVEMKRNHSTIIYYLKKYSDDYRFNSQFRILADKVSNLLNQKEL